MKKLFLSDIFRKHHVPGVIAAVLAASLALSAGSAGLSVYAAESTSSIQTDASILEILDDRDFSQTILGTGDSEGTSDASSPAAEGLDTDAATRSAVRHARLLMRAVGSDTAAVDTAADTETGDTAADGSDTSADAAEGTDSQTPAAAVGTAGTAWTDSEVLGSITADTAVSSRDDYYTAVNKDWILSAATPADSSETSVSSSMSALVESQKKSILTDDTLTDHDAVLARNLYDLLLDWPTRNAQGIAPIMPFIAAIQQISTIDDLTSYLCSDPMYLTDTGFTQPGISQYINNPDYYAVEVSPTQLLLSDAADYAHISRAGRLQLSLAQSECYYMLGRIGYSEDQIDAIFRRCIVFESAIAAYTYPALAAAAPDYYTNITNKPCTEEDLQKLAGAFPIGQILKARGLDGSLVYNVPQPMWLAELGTLYNNYNLEYLKDYLLVHTAIAAMELTDSSAFNVRTSLTSYFVGYSGAAGDDAQVAYNYVNLLLGRVLDNAYIRKYCSEETKTRVTDLTQTILSTYRQMLENSWLSDTAKEEALKKLDTITVRVDYPDTLPDFSALNIVSRDQGGTLVQAYKAIHTFSLQNASSLVNQHIDDSYWVMAAGTVNCYYNTSDNSINILAGMLNAPFYSSDYSNEEILSGIGFVIAHEISHAFDLTGASVDENGQSSNWWTDTDETIYLTKWNQMADYYSRIQPFTGAGTIQGEQVADEAMADLGGMECIMKIADKYPAFDYDRFFTHFASCWAGVRSVSRELLIMQTDEHPLYYLRVNVLLQQFRQFYETYGVSGGDGMYLAPGERISLWT